ncbi:MAG: serine hydrolase domain-containing protein [Myxococcota bacterium]
MHRWLALMSLIGCSLSDEPACPGLPDSIPSDWAVAPEGFDTEAFDQEVADAMRRGCIPALSASVVNAEGPILVAAWGFTNLDDPQPVTVETPFMVASTSKAVDALAVLIAESEGALDRDDPVSEHVGFSVRNHRLDIDEPIRLSHLLTHSSGIQDNWTQVLDDSYAPGDPEEPLGTFLERYLTPDGPHFHRRGNFYGWPPGREWLYSNVGVALAAYAVQQATAVPFDAYCETRIFEPLAMAHTGWFLTDFEDLDAIARPHVAESDGWKVLEHYGYPTWPDGQLRSTAGDLGSVLRVALGDGEVDGVRIVPQDAVGSLTSPLIEGLDDWYIRGIIPQQNLLWFGMNLEDRFIVGHDGDDEGVTSEMFFDPATGVGVTLLGNVSDGGLGHRTREATIALQQRLYAIGEAQP